MYLKAFYSLLLVSFFIGCTIKELQPIEREEKIQELTTMLTASSQHIDKKEARDLAKSSIHYAHYLAEQYKVVAPPLWHNTLVNFGVKERGLCYQWSTDLLIYLQKKNYTTLAFHRIGANIGSYFEHNALSVSAKEADINQSIVLDAWRDSGKLYFVELLKDKKYTWKRRDDMYE